MEHSILQNLLLPIILCITGMDLIELILRKLEKIYVMSQIDSPLKIREIIKITELVCMVLKKKKLTILEDMQPPKKRHIQTLNQLVGKES